MQAVTLFPNKGAAAIAMRGEGCHVGLMAEVVIESSEQLEEWLKNKPLLWGKVIALRCALRVFPVIKEIKWQDNISEKMKLSLATLRGLAIASSLIEFDNNEPIAGFLGVAYDVATDVEHAANVTSDSSMRADNSTYTATFGVFAASFAAYAASSVNTSNVAIFAGYASANAAEAVYITAMAANLAVSSYAYTAARNDIWKAVQRDVNGLENGQLPEKLYSSRIWNKQPQWFADQSAELKVYFEALGDYFTLWNEWYQRRVDGKMNAFASFEGNADEEFYRFLLEQDNDWWKREPALVNGDIKALVDSLRKAGQTQPDPQTANAPNFGYGPTGRIGVDALAGNKELSRDAGAQSRFNKLRQRLINLVAALKGNNNAGMLAEIADDILDVLGSAIEDTDPYSAVLDIESLRSAFDIQQAYGEKDDYRPLEGEQLRLAKNTIAAANLWVGSEEFLERIDATLPGPDHKRPLPERADAIALADALQSDDLTEPSADKIIRKSAQNIPETTDGEDRKTGLMVRGVLNLLRWSINAIVEHESEVASLATGAILGGGVVGAFTVGIGFATTLTLSPALFAFGLAKHIQKNEDIWRKWAQTARVTESNFDALMERIRNIPLK